MGRETYREFSEPCEVRRPLMLSGFRILRSRAS